MYLNQFTKIFRTIQKIIRDEEIARDLAQQTFLQAFKAKEKYKPTAPPDAWLHRIGHNITISYIRRQNTEMKYSQMFREEMQEVDIKKVDSKILLGKAMRFLNKNERQVIDMYYFRDLSDAMIGEQLGIPMSTARSRRRAAIDKMRIELGVV